MRLRNRIFLICLLALFACVPVRVKVHREEPPPAKSAPKITVPEKDPSEKTLQEKAPPEKAPPERPLQARIPSRTQELEPYVGKTYGETVSGWRSYQELARWMEKDFSTDKERYKKFEGTLPVPRTPEETFELKSGIYIDAALFAKAALDRIDPSLKAQVLVLIIRPYRFNHYVCSFNKDGKIFILDYGTPYKETTGLHGPYRSLNEYKKFYEKHHPRKREVEAITRLP